MTEYVIITILTLAVTFTYWRSRVWKRRASGYGFWGLVEKQMQRNQQTALLESKEWPEIIK